MFENGKADSSRSARVFTPNRRFAKWSMSSHFATNSAQHGQTHHDAIPSGAAPASHKASLTMQKYEHPFPGPTDINRSELASGW
ncbi:MAG: hypothetical protein EA381_10065 [Planctomycetaceae bacterium]|nr:MAG: hypothetical protein EA381_10065 [Planctomycetaceae bacterium]